MANYGPIPNNGIIGSGTKISTGIIGTFIVECNYPCRAALFRGSSSAPSYAGVSCLVYSLSDTTVGQGNSRIKDNNGGIYAAANSGAIPQYGYTTVLAITNDYGYGLYDWANFDWEYDIFETQNDAFEFLDNYVPIVMYPITYRLTNVTTTGPNEAAVGDTVTVPLTFPEGYGVVNPSSDAYVTCNGVLVPSTYSNGQLVFTMPDPS